MGVECIFYGGAGDHEKGELGGVQGLFHDTELGSRFLLDFGQRPDHWNEFYGFPYRPKAFNYLQIADLLEMYAPLREIMRPDYLRKMGMPKNGPTDLELLATHPHYDHIGGVHLLRPDMKIHMHETAKMMLYIWQQLSGRTNNQFVDFIDQFTLANKLGGDEAYVKGLRATISRDIHTFEPYRQFKVGALTVTAYPVDHSIPGSCAFIAETSAGKIAISGDLRLRGRGRKLTERFVQAIREQKVKHVFWEGSLMHFDHEGTEDTLVMKMAELIHGRTFVGYSAPPRDMERLKSMHLAAKLTGRILCIHPDQMIYLRAFDGEHGFPNTDDPNIAVIMTQKNKGNLDNEDVPSDIIEADYRYWERQFISWKKWEKSGKKSDKRQCELIPSDPGMGAPRKGKQRVTLEDIARYPDKFLVSMPPAYMIDMLTAIRPPALSRYIRSHPAPWTKDMEVAEDRLINALARFGLDEGQSPDHLTPNRCTYRMHTVHVTGHNNRRENREIFAQFGPDVTIYAYHCMHPRDFAEDVAKHLRVVVPIRNQPFTIHNANSTA
ncbi:hypothetical protein JW898_01620 [Candidatus Woesearchaeota archaeon]|nr:hypothetical protein [Candidatus Woesearchaeota archaeon]